MGRERERKEKKSKERAEIAKKDKKHPTVKRVCSNTVCVVAVCVAVCVARRWILTQ